MRKMGIAVMTIFLALCAGQAFARDWYVSGTGSGKKGTIDAPAKDIGNISSQFLPGDVIHVSAGTYLGKGECGTDTITVPVSIIGGYSPDFSSRDPWGQYRSVFSGNVMTKNWDDSPRIFIDLTKYREKAMPPILIDGIIVDRGAQNQYASADNLRIIRLANPRTGAMPTPESGGIVVKASSSGDTEGGTWKISVRNCVVTNAAPTMGALAVFAYAGSSVEIANNLVINCTGTGIYAGSLWKGSEEARAPAFRIEDNTVLFMWKYDPLASAFSGVGYDCDPEAVASLERNVFAFNDRIGISKRGSWPILLSDNVIARNVDCDYYESYTDTKMSFADMFDEGESIDPDSDGNTKEDFRVPVSAAWLEAWGSRVLIDRNAAAADLGVQRTRANEIRAALGLPVQADDLKADSAVWLPRLSLDDALAVCQKRLVPGKGADKTLIK